MSAAPVYTEHALIDDEPGEAPVLDLDRPMGDAECDALASALLGRLAECQADVARYRAALAREVTRLQTRYGSLIAPLERQATMFEQAIHELARRADFGKRRSRAVGNGVYGIRTVPERVEVTDAAAALAWAKDHVPTAVKAVTTEKLEHKVVAGAVLARVRGTGELPPGFEVHAAHDAPFAKPEVATDA